MLPLFFKRGYKLLLELPKEDIGSLHLPLESLIGRLQVDCGLREFQRNVIHVIAELRVVVITVI